MRLIMIIDKIKNRENICNRNKRFSYYCHWKRVRLVRVKKVRPQPNVSFLPDRQLKT